MNMSAEYIVEVSGKRFVVKVREEGRSLYRVQVGDKEVVVRMVEQTAGTAPEPAKEVRKVAEEPVLRSALPVVASAPTMPRAGTGKVITAAIPGKVLKVLVNEGDRVKAGDTVITLESMKMELEIKAPSDGVVKKILVKPGDAVNVGQTLVVLE